VHATYIKTVDILPNSWEIKKSSWQYGFIRHY